MGYNTYISIGKPLANRLNIVLSRTKNIEAMPNVTLLRSKEEVMALAKVLNSDLYIIGGAQVFETFADVIEKWIVTEVPLTVEDADVFMAADFLEGFELTGAKELDEGLKVKFFTRS